MTRPTQRQRIERALRLHGSITSTDFAAPDVIDGFPPIARVASRIDELRHRHGWRIKTTRMPNGVARYVLLSAPAAVSEPIRVPTTPTHDDATTTPLFDAAPLGRRPLSALTGEGS